MDMVRFLWRNTVAFVFYICCVAPFFLWQVISNALLGMAMDLVFYSS